MKRTFFFESALLPTGWARNVRVEARQGVVESISTAAHAAPGDQCERLVIPGLPNVHSHAFQRAMAGLSERLGPAGADDFWSWREIMYRFLGRLDPDDIEAIAAYAYADMLEAGFTSVGEFHYLHRAPNGDRYQEPAELALRHIVAANTTGIGLTLLPVFYESSQFGGAPPTEGQRRFISTVDEYVEIMQRAASHLPSGTARNLGIAPHSLRAVTFGHLREVLGQFPGVPVHIHAAEQTKEVRDCVAFCSQRPVQWLLANTDVDKRWCLVHATHMTPDETAGLARSGAVAGVCPITEANLGDGIFPAMDYLAAGGRLAVGTDSHIELDAAGELRQLEYSQRLQSQTRNALATQQEPETSARLLQLALRGGAQALQQPVGAIETGNRADFLVLDAEHPDLIARDADQALATWMFAGARRLLHKVIVGGDIVVEDGKHRGRDAIDSAYRRVVRRLMTP